MRSLLLGCMIFLPWVAQSQPEIASETLASESFESADLFARDSFRIHPMICPFKGDIEYQPGDIECGLLQVPENREKPDSRFIELHFVKISSTWDDQENDDQDDDSDKQTTYDLQPGKRDDPVIYLTGGPGAKVTYYVDRLKDHGILAHRDLYILEQRGIGFSDDFCPYYNIRNPAAAQAETFEDHLDTFSIATRQCAENAIAEGVDLSGYNSIENARDVHALRRALGFDQWNVWGISYGSILGQAYIKQDPEGIRAVVLDAIVPLNVRDDPLYWRVVNWYDRDLKKLDELCQADENCAEHYPNLGQRVRQAAQSLRDNPIVVDIKDTEVYPSGKARFFQDVGAFLPFIFLYEQKNYPGMPGLIYAWADAVERRDETLFKAFAQAGGGFINSSQGMADAVFCLDGDSEAQAIAGKHDIREHPILGAAIGSIEAYDKGARLCHELGMAPRNAADFSPVQTDIPSLIIEGDMDPITPPPLAKAILPGFSNGTYVEFPYAGHGPSRSVECAGDMLNAFYDSPDMEPDLSCVDQMKAPEFLVPLFTTSAGPRMMLKALEDKKSLAVPGIWGGSSILIVLTAFAVLTFAPLGRGIDNSRAAIMDGGRLAAWFAALFGTGAVLIIGLAMAATYEVNEALLIFGLVPWAYWGAWCGVLAGLFGLLTIVLTIRARRRRSLPIGTLLGLMLTGIAATSLSVFLMYWDLGPL